MIRKILKKLLVIQIVSNKKREKAGLKTLGRGYKEAARLNPYNPLSYLTIIVVLVFGIVLFGFYGFWKEIDLENPFKWH